MSLISSEVLGKGAYGGLVIITEVLLPFSGDHWVPVLLEDMTETYLVYTLSSKSLDPD